jgi:hypothetical protein
MTNTCGLVNLMLASALVAKGVAAQVSATVVVESSSWSTIAG